MLQMRLEQAEPIEGELSGLFREPDQFVHTRRVRQIACKFLRQIICKVTKMVRTKQWKMTYYPGHGGELYDLVNDPHEQRKLFDEPARRSLVADFKQAILDS